MHRSAVLVVMLAVFLGGCHGSDTALGTAPASNASSQRSVGGNLGPRPSGPRSVDNASATALSKPPTEETFQERFHESRFVRAHDLFRATDDPRVVSADEATFLCDDDQVLGFVVHGQARAYSVGALCYHHVVNDQIGETPMAVTY